MKNFMLGLGSAILSGTAVLGYLAYSGQQKHQAKIDEQLLALEKEVREEIKPKLHRTSNRVSNQETEIEKLISQSSK